MRRQLFFVSLTVLALGISARATTYTAPMLGIREVPPNTSTATGFTTLSIVDNSMTVMVDWTGLIGGPASMAHVHCCTPPGTNATVAVGYTGFPATTSGTYTATFNLLDPSIYTSMFLTTFGGGTAAGARNALAAGLDAGQAYSNIHNAQFPGGEIRGDLVLIPEPTSLLLIPAGLLVAAYVRRRRAPR